MNRRKNLIIGRRSSDLLCRIFHIPLISQEGSNCNRKAFIANIFLFLLQQLFSTDGSSPLNLQPLKVNNPFFQGWLIRNVDHVNNCSFILIVGSFSKEKSDHFDEHYVFCSITTKDYTRHAESFPSPSLVSIKARSPASGSGSLDLSWAAKDLGGFSFSDRGCVGEFDFGHEFRIKFNSTARMSWKHCVDPTAVNCPTNMDHDINIDGPEGWLGYTPLLPCRYFVHSVGSRCSYEVQTFGDRIDSKGLSSDRITGQGYAHIEGNHGSFFPEGWTWCQGIAPSNEFSLSFVGGKFDIAGLTPMNFVVFFRRRNGHRVIFRTTDLDKIVYSIHPTEGIVKISASSRNIFRRERLEITVQSEQPSSCHFGKPIYIPTAKGFSNTPGCVETYTAMATVKYFDSRAQKVPEIYFLPLTALEFGGSFVGKREVHWTIEHNE